MTILSKRGYPPLLPAFACLCLGILAAVYLSQVPKPILILAFIAAIALGTIGLKLPRAIGLSALAAAFWGLGVTAFILYRAGPDIAAFADSSEYTLTGRIASFADDSPLNTRYILNCETIQSQTSENPAKVFGRIHLSVYKKSVDPQKNYGSDLPYGAKVKARVHLRPIRNFANPGGFDYERHLLFQGITASAWANAGNLQVLLPEDGKKGAWNHLMQHLQRIRQTCLGFIMNRGSPEARGDPLPQNVQPQAKAVMAAMILGQKSGLDQSIKDSFARVGVSHILSISGLHLSIIGLFSYLLFLHLFKPCQRLVVRGQVRKIALTLTLVPLSVYAVVAGFSPATQRALVMASVFILAMTLEHETDPMNTLLAAGILILAFRPPALFSISFQLSFSAVGGILTGMAWVNRKRLVPAIPLLGKMAAAFWVSLFAGIVTLPLTATYFNMVSFIFLVSNLVLVPIMGLVCLPLGLGAMVLIFVCPSLAGGVLDLGLSLICLSLEIIRFMEALPLAWARVITPTWTEILVYYGVISGVFAILNERKQLGFRLVSLATAVGICCAGIGIKQRFFPGDLAVTALDVGQGACALVLTPRGKVILIDCGGFASGGGFNVGRYVVGPYLWRNRIRTIDLVILSHPQSDHMNGLGFILDNFKIRQWLRNRDDDKGGFLENLRQRAAARKVPVRHPRSPATPLNYGPVRLLVLPSRPGFFSDLNQNSLVVRLEYGGFSMLFTGDIDSSREEALVSVTGIPLASSVMVAPHHGSRNSSSKIFLDCVNPESVIVSCGYRNRYGFPHSEVLNRYNTRKIQVYRTDIHGAVTVSSSGNGYEINTVRNH